MSNYDHLHLGKPTEYISRYNPQLLTPVPRSLNRDLLPLEGRELPFVGVDFWTAYELSWLNHKGKPQVALGIFEVPANSVNLVESKSFKLYLNSFNDEPLTMNELQARIQKDISSVAGEPVKFHLCSIDGDDLLISKPRGTCIDTLDIECNDYQVTANLLANTESEQIITETLYSNLLKSNCLITSQPDWATVTVSYTGQGICHESLLRYVISYRNHNEFHEHCVERMFVDIWQQCRPQKLTVKARYTRRGGLDINPVRSSEPEPWKFQRLIRQ
jgi:7-cyano-7-deazaguanine reductase